MEKITRGYSKFSVEDKNLLLLIALKEIDNIESKTKNSGSSRQSEGAWERIEKVYNSLTKGEPKDARSLRHKYAAMKREIKKDTGSKQSEHSKTKEKIKKVEEEEMPTLDECAASTMDSSEKDFSKEITTSTPNNAPLQHEKETSSPQGEIIEDLNMDFTPINKLPPQKIPIYDARSLSSEIDDIVRVVMKDEKEASTETLEGNSDISSRDSISQARDSGHWMLDGHKQVLDKRLEILRLQKIALKQFMRHKREEHKLKIQHLEVEHRLRTKYFGMDSAEKSIKSD